MINRESDAGRVDESLTIGQSRIGNREPVFVIAEVGNAHDGNLNFAHAFIDAVADTGVQAIKFQTHIAAAESTHREPFRVKFSHLDATRWDYWHRMEFTVEQWQQLKTHADDRGLIFLSSPFSIEAVDLLRKIGVPAWKVASGEVSNTPMLDAMIATGLPVLLSSGMSGWREIEEAHERCRRVGVRDALFHCTTSYPCPPEKVGLNVIGEMKQRFGVPVGLSDHSGDLFASTAAVALGADLVEVHVCFGRQAFGPDTPASLTPDQLRRLVRGVTQVRAMVQHPVDKDATADQLSPLRQLFCKSIVFARALPAGTALEPAHLVGKKPGDGVPIAQAGQFVGRRLRVAVEADESLDANMVE